MPLLSANVGSLAVVFVWMTSVMVWKLGPITAIYESPAEGEPYIQYGVPYEDYSVFWEES